MTSRIVSSFVLLGISLTALAADEYYVLPYKPDPAIAVDGNLNDWESVPNAIELKDKEQVTYGVELWKGPEDLSATIRLAWRDAGIFIAADVTDDRVLQPFEGREMWKADHVNVWMDLTPGVEPQREMIGTGQFHVGLSPGNFGVGDKKIPAEIYAFRPEGLKQEGGQIVSRRTEKGYLIEAFIPVSLVDAQSIVMHKDANFEVAPSDADDDPPKQDTLMTRGTREWAYSRNRLLAMVFGDGNGVAPPPLRAVKLKNAETVPTESQAAIAFKAEPIPEGKQAFVFFRARFDSPTPVGYHTGTLLLELNGQKIEGGRLSNRPARSTMMDGRDINVVGVDDTLTLAHGPSGDAIDAHSNYGLIDGVKATDFEFDLTGLLKDGDNTLVIRNLATRADEEGYKVSYAAVMSDIELRVRAKLPPPPPPKPAPTGEIATIEPQKEFSKTYSDLSKEPGKIAFTLAGKPAAVKSRFTTPDGKWQTGSNDYFEHRREVIEHDEWIEVKDHFTNRTDEDLPLIQEHTYDAGDAFKGAWLAGVAAPSGSGNRSDPENPSVFASTNAAGVGLLAMNDEFQVHVNQFAQDGVVGIRDGTLYVKPRGTYTAEFAIVPTSKPDFWAFVNAARRLRNVNFTLPLNFAFLFHRPPVYEWPDTTYQAYLENKGTNFLVASNEGVRTTEGHPARINDWMNGPLTFYVDFLARARKFFPPEKLQTAVYFDCFLDTTKENKERFKADRGLDASGNHIDYGGSHSYMQLYIPTNEPGHWGEQVWKTLDTILLDLKYDGIFWDEPSYSRAWYVYGHEDGCSADINPQTFKLERKKGSVPLLSQDFRLRVMKRMIDENRPVMTNGAPVTRTMMQYPFQAFTETGSISNCRLMILHSPVALGDHLTEQKYEDSYRVMHGALDNGCLYAFYPHILHTNKAPTYYMYPTTPIEIREGIFIGQERIVTNRSGYFGWGDASSSFEAHVFDRAGVETTEVQVPRVERDGKAYGEVRLPEGFMAILVRK